METTEETTEIVPIPQWKCLNPVMSDMMSFLPDEILSHILSFLPTKHAVGTSVLSRRWKDLWTGRRDIDLDNRDRRCNRDEIREMRDLDFCSFVERVLSRHKNLNSLRRFRLHFAVEHIDCRAMPNLLARMGLASDESQLEEMDVRFEGHRTGSSIRIRSLPEAFYSLKHLRALKLEGVILVITFGSVLLPKLSILQLSRSEFWDLETLSSLISGCPGLETLHLETCHSVSWNENGKLVASLPSLKSLTIIDNSSYCPMCHFEIETPSLEQLDLRDFAELQFLGTSSPLPCLGWARVQICDARISEHGLVRFLAHISYAKEMCLSSDILELLSGVGDDVELPVFPNLTHLTIATAGSNWVLHSLLNSASKLQYLVIDFEDDWGAMEFDESKVPARTPECLLSSLEEVKIENLKADEDEMKTVAYLLRAGAVLKKVNMHMFDCANMHIYLERLGSLLSLPRGSRACEAHLFLNNGNEIWAVDKVVDHTGSSEDGSQEGSL